MNSNHFHPNLNHQHHHQPQSFKTQNRWGLFPEAVFDSNHQFNLHSSSKQYRFSLLRTYLPDWILTLILSIVSYFLGNLPGFQREFDLNDASIQHTYAQTERVSVGFLLLYSLLIPAVVILGSSLAILRSPWDLHNGLLGLFLSQALTLTITGAVKNTVGRPRPDFLDRCQPDPSKMKPLMGMTNSKICTTSLNSKVLIDGFRSFPSGHSSTAWCGLGFLALYLAGKVHLFDRRGHTLKAWLVVSPLLGAALISISRTMDYRHHWQDVFVGGALGMAMAWFGYRLYYPPLDSPAAHIPSSPRLGHSNPVDLESDPQTHQLDHEGHSRSGSHDIMLRP